MYTPWLQETKGGLAVCLAATADDAYSYDVPIAQIVGDQIERQLHRGLATKAFIDVMNQHGPELTYRGLISVSHP